MIYFVQGLTMGLAYVAPIGLQNLFVINTALTQPRQRAYATAFTVVFFDVTLALACFFGIGAIMAQSIWLKMGVLLVGSLIVIYIGICLLQDKGDMDMATDTVVNIPLLKVIGSACVVTWFNPQALIDGSMMLGAFKASLPTDQSITFIIGVACASISWFLGLTTIITLFSAKITPKILRIINVVCGIVIIFYGLKLAYNFIQLIIPTIV
ncbi:MAG: LysE family transporter [Anaerovoracaceae bacterium]